MDLKTTSLHKRTLSKQLGLLCVKSVFCSHYMPHTAIEVAVKTNLSFIMPTVKLLYDFASHFHSL